MKENSGGEKRRKEIRNKKCPPSTLNPKLKYQGTYIYMCVPFIKVHIYVYYISCYFNDICLNTYIHIYTKSHQGNITSCCNKHPHNIDLTQ